MKQIFDWLREQMQNRIAYNESCHEEFKDRKMALTYEVQQNAWKNALAMVDEAEAKWESEHCTECENCGTKLEKDSNGDYVCGLCGRDTARLRELEEEADCCEWVLERELVGIPIYKTCHKTQPYYNDGDKKFCPYCGKRIKILEVE